MQRLNDSIEVYPFPISLKATTICVLTSALLLFIAEVLNVSIIVSQFSQKISSCKHNPIFSPVLSCKIILFPHSGQQIYLLSITFNIEKFIIKL